MTKRRKTKPTALRAISYTRVSTGKQAESGLGLTDQAEGIASAIERKGWVLVHQAQDAGASARTLDRRPDLAKAIAMLDAGEADVLVAAKLDRVSRSVRDFGDLLERAQRKGWKLVVLDLDVDTSTPGGEFLANTISSAARYESRLIGARVAASHRVRREQGKRAGQSPLLPAAVRERIASERNAGRTMRAIADDLNGDAVPTAKGGTWHASTVAHVLRSLDLDSQLAKVSAKQ